ncbi:MAG: PLDc N-terminal domain-containing protein [Leptospiraceae bacterium]|nr:PLDc N-terminal domain-containing protein [Leptospiraceae bacterium]
MIDSLKTPGFIEYLVGMYAYYLPFILYMVWAPISIYDLSGKNEEGSAGIIWTLVLILIPVIGAALYLILGKSNIQKTVRFTMVYGGLGFFLFVFILAKILNV